MLQKKVPTTIKPIMIKLIKDLVSKLLKKNIKAKIIGISLDEITPPSDKL